jgi:hypothetical protein
MRRWEKIARALGTRTARQVSIFYYEITLFSYLYNYFTY